MRRLGCIRGHHLLFGVALAALLALGVWWTVFFKYSIKLERQAALDRLAVAALMAAQELGEKEDQPKAGTLPEYSPLEVIPESEQRPGDLFAPAIPLHPTVGVRPQPKVMEALAAKAARRRVMLLGEGTLLFLLLGVCTVMLFQLVRSERSQKRRIEAFLSGATHEMKTPLAGIKSLLQTFAAGKVPREQQAALWTMGLKEVERLEHLVENVLISGRLRSEMHQIHTEPVGVRALLEVFVEHRRRYLVGRPDAIRLVWESVAAELSAVGDRNALFVVLDNLTDNALKYGQASPSVRLRVRAADGAVEIAVEDDGVGFDPARGDRLFDPFQRAMDDKEGVHHGTGLGLTISKALVERMGGRIRAESTGPGKGSCFTVTLREAGR